MGWVTGRIRSIQHKSGRRVDSWGTYFRGNGLGRREKPIDNSCDGGRLLHFAQGVLQETRRTQRVTGFMQELTSAGTSGRHPTSPLFGYLLRWCWLASELLDNDLLNGNEGSATREKHPAENVPTSKQRQKAFLISSRKRNKI